MNRFLKILRLMVICMLAISAIAGMVYYFKLVEVIFAIISLELGKSDIVTISRKNLFFITKKNSKISSLIQKMESIGWSFTNKYGRGLIFTRGGEEIVLLEKDIIGLYKIFVLESMFRDNDNIKGY